jgi:hypothetical protein
MSILALDGGLYPIFKSHTPDWLWSRLETGAVCPGIPDSLFVAPGGTMGLVEFKQTSGWRCKFQPLQIPFIHRVSRLGGRVFIAVRRKKDELFVIEGSKILELEEFGLKKFSPIEGIGARNWNWDEVESRLLSKDPI